MVILLTKGYKKEELSSLTSYITACGATYNLVCGKGFDYLELSGDVYKVDPEVLREKRIVAGVEGFSSPYVYATKKSGKTAQKIITVGSVKIGGGNFTVIAGPCSVESERAIIDVAVAVKNAGADILRGGAFKPRTSPYTFQGLGEDGVKFLIKAKKETGLPIVTEITGVSRLNLFSEVDLIQIGARNMQNFELLKEVAKLKKPIFLKRGFSNTVRELLFSAEYLLSEGADDVILCERGIRTFETITRSTLDLSSVAALKTMTDLPVFVDPSHASGSSKLVKPLSLASAAVGADGLMIETHLSPEEALSDGAESVTPAGLKDIIAAAKSVVNDCKTADRTRT